MTKPRVARVDENTTYLARAMAMARGSKGEQGKAIFLIGAGCSVSAGIPLAVDVAKYMVSDVAARFGVTPTDDPARCHQELVDRGHIARPGYAVGEIDWYSVYDVMFRDFYTTPDDQRDLFTHLITKTGGALNWAHLCLGELVRERYISTVLTTNFDQLVLAGMVRAGVIPMLCDGVESLHRISGSPTYPQLVELHGSRHTYRLRNSPEEVEEVGRDVQARNAILKLLQGARTLVVVGYAGREQSVMELLTDAARIYSDKNLFWATYSKNPEDLNPRVKMFLATSRNASQIIGQDADSFFMELCDRLGIGAPASIRDPLSFGRDVIVALERSNTDNVSIRAELLKARETLRLYEDNTTEITAKRADLAWNGQTVNPELLIRAARTALEHGKTDASEGSLRRAIELSRDALANERWSDSLHRELVNILGEALWRLGDRQSDPVRLKAAVELLHDEASKPSQQDAQFVWATTQTILGHALSTLGELENNTARLEQAATAYRAALKVYSRDRMPLDWGQTQTNLGIVLQALGERASGTRWLDEAVTAFRAALEVRAREQVPLDWATTQNNLGNALATLGEREGNTARLQEAVIAFHAALEERTREQVPLDWAATQNNLGAALTALDEREGGTSRLEQAVMAYHGALEERTRERAPLDWAYSQHGLAEALVLLAMRLERREMLEDALVRMRDAAAVYRETDNDYWLAIAEQRITNMEATLTTWPNP